MSGVLRLSNNVTGRSTIIASAIDDQTYVLPALGGTLLTGGSNSELIFPPGTEALPGLHVQGDVDTGLYAPAANTLAISTGGSERLRVDNDGRLLIGTTTARGDFYNASTVFPFVQVQGTGNERIVSITAVDTGSASGGSLVLAKSRSTGNTIVQNGDSLGAIQFQGADGSEIVDGAQIKVQVDGTPDADSMPGRLVFSTTADGEATTTERVRIDSLGRVLINTSTSVSSSTAHKLQVADSVGGYLNLARSATSVSNNSILGRIGGYSNAGSSYDNVGNIDIASDGTHAAGDKPTRLVFSTTADSSSSPTERMRIDNAGRVTLKNGGSNYASEFQGDANQLVITNNGTCGLTIDATSATNSSIHFADGTTGDESYRGFLVYNHADDSLRIGTAGDEQVRVSSAGQLIINYTSNVAPDGYDSKLQLCDTSYQGSSAVLRRDQNTPSGPTFILAKSRSSTKGGNALLSDGDDCGSIRWYGNDGVDQSNEVARIRAIVDGTPGTNQVPGSLLFFTTPVGSAVSTESMRITAAGNITVGGNTDGTTPAWSSTRTTVRIDGAQPVLYLNETDVATGSQGSYLGVSSSNLYLGKEGGSIIFQTSAPGDFTQERLRIDSIGNFGIGTQYTTPGLINLPQPGTIQWLSSVGNARQGIQCSTSDHLDVYTGQNVLAARFNQLGCLGLGGGSALAGSETSGDFNILLTGLRQLVGSVWRQGSILVYYSGVDGTASNQTTFLASIAIRGLSTWNGMAVSNIFGTANVTLSDNANTSCRLNFDVPDGNSGSVFCILNCGAGTNAYSTGVTINA